MNTVSEAHKEFVHSVASRYRSDGYEVIIDPGPNAVPFDLGGYSPDIIACKGNLSLIVEVKAGVERISFDRLSPLVEETKRHEGWRFVLVTGQDVLGLDLPIEPKNPVSWEEIGDDIEHARRLRDSGERELAYLVLWIAFERMMRNHAFDVGLPLDRVAPGVLIRHLYSQGELSIEQFDAALDCQKLRNRVVHGFHAEEILDGFERLGDLLSDLLPLWSVPYGHNTSPELAERTI